MKYKILKVVISSDIYDSYVTNIVDTLDWRECSDDEFEEITKACQTFNLKNCNMSVMLVSDQYNSDNGVNTLINDHRKYMAELAEQNRKDEERRQKEKERKAQTAYNKKLKQLEKLKKELDQQ